MLTRIISAVVGIILLGYTINIGGWIFYAGISLLNICALYELYRALGRKNIHINFFLSSAFAVVLLYFARFNTFDFILTYLFIILFFIGEFIYIIVNNHRFISRMLFSIFSFVYTTFIYGMILIRNLKDSIFLT